MLVKCSSDYPENHQSQENNPLASKYPLINCQRPRQYRRQMHIQWDPPGNVLKTSRSSTFDSASLLNALSRKLDICDGGTTVSRSPLKNKIGVARRILCIFAAEFHRWWIKNVKYLIMGISLTTAGIERNVFSKITASILNHTVNNGPKRGG